MIDDRGRPLSQGPKARQILGAGICFAVFLFKQPAFTAVSGLKWTCFVAGTVPAFMITGKSSRLISAQNSTFMNLALVLSISSGIFF
ncbi:hypothetical protein QBD00_003317 [Ochrobactrum sp. AN78]|nr:MULTISPECIES: hypothetical protein [Brucella/Ochrobactrum group]MDH7792398.1 hypothetical protein [Ochrobactrum sp. AN78]